MSEKQKMELQKQRAREKADKYYTEHTQDLRELEQQEKENFRSLLEHADIQSVMKSHQGSLHPIFKLYATQDKKQEIGYEDKITLMNSTEFVKLCKQYGLSGGKEITQDDIVQVFRAITRERDEAAGSVAEKGSKLSTSIEYQEYEKAMLKLHVLWNSGQQNQTLKAPAGQRQVSDHPQRILKALATVSAQSFDQFLYKFETKSLKGYSTRLKTDASKTAINQDMQHLDLEQPTIVQSATTKIA